MSLQQKQENKLRCLPQHLINQIAAGEVVERPAAIIKELIENSLDANSNAIEVTIVNGGKTLITVKDNGWGIPQDDLQLCLQSHTTSKLIDDNLVHIYSLGFRGEALASIASVSKIIITSKHHSTKQAYSVNSKGGIIGEVMPASLTNGTSISVADIFYNTPARLKFLRSDNTEALYCYKIFKRLALSNYAISFKLINNGKTVYNYPALNSANKIEQINNRVSQILGQEFLNNSIYIDHSHNLLNIYGLISKPTFNKNNGEDQFIVVNGRSLKDKFLTGVIKAAYSEVLFAGRFAVYVLFLDISAEEIDINVNPTKSEVKFRDPSFIRHIIYKNIKEQLSNISNQNNNKFIGETILNDSSIFLPSQGQINLSLNGSSNNTAKNETNLPATHAKVDNTKTKSDEEHPLGYAKAQLHKNWVIAQNKNGIVLVDQHAAHERITQEKYKQQYLSNNIPTQTVFSIEVINLTPSEFLLVETYADKIISLGIKFTVVGENAISVSEYPAILKNPNMYQLIQDLLRSLAEVDLPVNFDKYLNSIIATLACHNSIRAGRELTILQMNELLRSMENTPNYAQCSHGRPTFVQLDLNSIERLFGRK